MKKIQLLFLTSLIVFLSACDSSNNAATQSQTVNLTTNLKNVAWMREKLPENTLSYFRLPSIWQMFFETKGDALHVVQELEQNQALIDQFKQGVVNTYEQFVPTDAQLTFKTFMQNMTSPFEVAIINATDGSMIPNSLFATTLRDTSIDDLNAMLDILQSKSNSQIRLLKPFDDQGYASYIVTMVPTFLSFDANTGRLAIFSGLTASHDGLMKIMSQAQHHKSLDNIFAFENSVDQSGKNVEMWFNIKGIYQQNKSFIKSVDLAIFKKLGIENIDFAWIGTASKNGKSEFLIHIAMPDVGVRQFMPRVDSQFDVKTAGSPKSVWQFAMPSLEQLTQAFELALSFNPNPEKIRQETLSVINKINDFLTVPLSEIYVAYGQKLLIITDDSGTWFASKINDINAHEEISAKISKALNIKSSTKTLAGVSINQSIFSTKDIENKIMGSTNMSPAIFQNLGMNNYSYYQIENNYFIQAFTPQVLADRSNSKNKQNLSTWLNQQQINWDKSVLAHSAEVRDVSRDIYHTYLSVLLFVSNFANIEIDLFKFPTAQQLNLPKKGRFGFAMDSSQEALTLRLSYEYSIFEGMSITNTYFTFAVVGILAAYSVPAYNDYTQRSKASNQLFSLYKEQKIIESYFEKHKSFPQLESVPERFIQSEYFNYNPENGQLTIFISKNQHNNTWLKMTPEVYNEKIEWHCTGNLLAKHLPRPCLYSAE